MLSYRTRDGPTRHKALSINVNEPGWINPLPKKRGTPGPQSAKKGDAEGEGYRYLTEIRGDIDPDEEYFNMVSGVLKWLRGCLNRRAPTQGKAIPSLMFQQLHRPTVRK